MLTQLLLAVNGYGFGTAEYAELKDRMDTLSRQTQSNKTAGSDPASHMPDAVKY